MPEADSDKVWVLVFCNAEYDNTMPENHFVPAWSRKQLGEAEFQRVLAESEALLTEQQRELDLNRDLLALELEEAESEEDEAFVLSRIKSLKGSQQRLLGR